MPRQKRGRSAPDGGRRCNRTRSASDDDEALMDDDEVAGTDDEEVEEFEEYMNMTHEHEHDTICM